MRKLKRELITARQTVFPVTGSNSYWHAFSTKHVLQVFRGTGQQQMVLTRARISRSCLGALSRDGCEALLSDSTTNKYMWICQQTFLPTDSSRGISQVQTGCGKHEVQSHKFFTKIFLQDRKLKVHEHEFLFSVWNISLTLRLNLKYLRKSLDLQQHGA